MCLFSLFNAWLNAVCSSRLYPYTGEQREEKKEGGKEEGKDLPTRQKSKKINTRSFLVFGFFFL